MKIKTQVMQLTEITSNSGQIIGLPKNPRVIRDEKYLKLLGSIQADPEMLDLREIVVKEHQGEHVIICGNMRFKAMQELGIKKAPIKILPEETPVDKLRAFAIKDNVNYGQWDWDDLANEWKPEELAEWGMDVWQDTGFDPNMNPDFSRREVGDDEFDRDLKYRVGTQEGIEVVCPHCGETFRYEGL